MEFCGLYKIPIIEEAYTDVLQSASYKSRGILTAHINAVKCANLLDFGAYAG